MCVCDRATNSYRRSWMLLKPIERDRKQKRESLISNGWMWEVVLSGVHRAQSGAVQLINEHSEDFRYCLDKQLLFLALRFPNTVTMTIFSLYPSLWPVWGETWRSMCVCVFAIALPWSHYCFLVLAPITSFVPAAEREREQACHSIFTSKRPIGERKRGRGARRGNERKSVLCLDFISIEEEVHNRGLYILVSEKQSINRARPTLAEHCGAFEWNFSLPDE